ncbi:MAG TPA: efflux RND transporter periplasmic adaptor subunit [Polyangiaceae bacterium]
MDDVSATKPPAPKKLEGDPEVMKKLGVGQPRRARRWVLRIVLLLATAATAAGIWFLRQRAELEKQPSYVTAPVERGDLRETVTATGTLSPLDQVEVGAEVTGRVTAVLVDINDQVKKDQVLVEIDTEQLSARVDESQAQLRSAHANQANANATVKEAESKAARAREMHQRGLISDQDLEAAQAALERAKASVSTSSAQITVAAASLKSAKTSLGKAIIRAPIDGIVLARTIEVGQTVTSGFQTPVLLTLARGLEQMQLQVDVDEADVGRVHENQTATFVVDAYPRRTFRSTLVTLSNLPKTGTTVVTYQATLTVENPERLLKPGMTATATLVTSEEKDVLSVPNAALRFEPPAPPGSAKPGAGLPLPGLGGPMRGMGMRSPRPQGSARPGGTERVRRQHVYVLKQGVLTKVPVEVGATDGRRTAVKGEGIGQGTQVVVDVNEGKP